MDNVSVREIKTHLPEVAPGKCLMLRHPLCGAGRATALAEAALALCTQLKIETYELYPRIEQS